MRMLAAFLPLVLLSLPAGAGIPDPADNSTASVSGPGCLFITPGGNGPTLASRGLTVTVTVRDNNDDPIAGYPFQDIVLTGGVGETFLCNGGSVADGNTNAEGITTISGAIAGGGTSFANAQVYLAGVAIPTVLPIDLVSPDFSGDLAVNIVDLAPYADEYATPVYDARGDFNCDGAEGLQDVGLFAVHNGESCP